MSKPKANIQKSPKIRALEQIRRAADTLRDKIGDDVSRSAGNLLLQLANALEFGDCYPLKAHTEAFDKARKD